MKVDVVQYMCNKHLKKVHNVCSYVDLQFHNKNFELTIFLATSLFYIYVCIYL